VRPIAPAHPIDTDEPQVRLVDERRRLQRVIGALISHVVMRETPQLAVYDGQEGVARCRVAIRPRREQLRHLLSRRRLFVCHGGERDHTSRGARRDRMAPAMRPAAGPSRRYEHNVSGWLAVHSSATKIRSAGTPASSS
jgi:hypothetical protein